MATEQKKKCMGRCGKTLPLSEFYGNDKTPDGLVYQCKKCISEHGYTPVRVKKVCPICGEEFQGPPKSKYCPAPKDCRDQSEKLWLQQYYKKRREQGLTARGTERKRKPSVKAKQKS
jgi:hypothetical protein